MSTIMSDHIRHLQERLAKAEADRDAALEALRDLMARIEGNGTEDDWRDLADSLGIENRDSLVEAAARCNAVLERKA
jgi:hypothetical protein